MKIISLAFLCLLFLGCNREVKDNKNELQSIIKETEVIIDTLFFDKRMNGKILTEKYSHGLSELQFYKKFVSKKKIAKKQIVVKEDTKNEIIYLGKLKDLGNQDFYHVVASFKIIGIGKMDSPRGLSNVVFIDKNLEKAIIYSMGMPNRLPIKIEENVLYFNYKNEKIGISISGGLPPMICVPKIGCYD